MNETVLRPADISEAEILTEISEKAFNTDYLFGGKRNDGPPDYNDVEWHEKMIRDEHLFAFEKDGEIIGGAVLFKEQTTLYIGRIFISPEYMHMGYGMKLMIEIEDYYKDVKSFTLDTPIYNTRTNPFYKKLGYKETGRDSFAIIYNKKV